MPLTDNSSSRADIEYPTGGSGLYATASDYARLLQNILIGYQRYASSIAPPKDFSPILSLESYNRILSPDLAASQIGSLAAMMNGYFNLSSDEGDTLIGAEDVSVGLGDLPIYTGKERKGGWGRCSGSAGWGGAAGTDVSNISIVRPPYLLEHPLTLILPQTVLYRPCHRYCRVLYDTAAAREWAAGKKSQEKHGKGSL